MAGKQIGGDGGLPANLAGMTKSQLYDIMSQMKALIDENHQQAREILIRNPLLTKALFQAQIMLGMVQPPQAIRKVEPQQSIPNVHQAHMSSSIQGGGGLQEPAAMMQPKAPIRKQPTPMPPPPPPPPPPPSAPSQPRFSHPQRQGHLNPAVTSLSHQPPAASSGGPHLAQQHPRPPYHHQFEFGVGPSQTGFQHHHAAPPQHHSQPMFHSGNRPPASGQPPVPHQGGGQFRGDYNNNNNNNNNQLGGPVNADRGPSWMPGQSESSNITHLPGLGPVPPPSQVGPGPGAGQPPRPAPISADMEKALLQQVMSLTQEQINLLPPEQRNQVFQLQQMLRQ